MGCATMTSQDKRDPRDVVKVWVKQTAAVTVDEAYSDGQELYVNFNSLLKDSSHQKGFYAYANLDPNENKNVDFTKNLAVSIDIISFDQWKQKGSQLQKLVSLDNTYWLEYRKYLSKNIAINEKNVGVVVRNDEEELIFYYDENQELVVKDLVEKPVEVIVRKILSQIKLREIVLSSMEDFLKSKKNDSTRILMTMSLEDDYTNPFLFVDLENKVVASLKFKTSTKNKHHENVFRKSVKSVDYLIESNILGVITRPVSTTYRLLSWTKGTTSDIVIPSSIRLPNNAKIASIYEGHSMDLEVFEKKLDNLVKSKRSSGVIQFYIGGDEYFPRLIEAFIGAKKSINLRTFIFDNDDYAVEIADVLKKKSLEKGVKVKVLLDGMGQIMGEGKIADDLPPDFVSPVSIEKYLLKDSKVKVHVRSSALFKADHTKTTTIDEDLSFTGGMNIGREYRYDWHDLMMEVRGPIVGEILKDFNYGWAYASKWGDIGYLKQRFFKSDEIVEGEGYPIRALYTKPNDPQIFRAQILAIREAKKYIYVHNAYFSDNAILGELIKARKRGVDVRVILPVNGNHEIMNASNVVTANIMFEKGIRVYFYPGMSHVKAAIYDGWLCTGSANFDKLSFRDNIEFNLATSDPESVNYLKEHLFEKDFVKSLEMTQTLESSWRERLAEFLAEQL